MREMHRDVEGVDKSVEGKTSYRIRCLFSEGGMYLPDLDCRGKLASHISGDRWKDDGAQ